MASFVMLASGIVFCSCSDDGSETDGPRLMGFAVTVNDVSTRGTLVTDDDGGSPLTAFAVTALFNNGSGSQQHYFDNLTVARDGAGSSWSYSPAYYWPGVVSASNPMTFVAYAPLATDGNGLTVTPGTGATTPTIQYVTPVTLADQPDLLFAQTTAYKTNEAVNLPFNHILTSHRFVVGSTMEAGLQIRSITFSYIQTDGTYTKGASGYDWELASPAAYADRSHGDTTDATEDVTYLFVSEGVEGKGTNILGTECFILLPQTLTTDAKLIIDAYYEDAPLDPSKTHIALAELCSTWAAGKTYTYTIIYEGPDTGIQVSVEETNAFISHWKNGESTNHNNFNW